MAGWVKSLIYYVVVRQQQSGAVEACGARNLALLTIDFNLYGRDVKPTLFVNSSFESLRWS